MYNDNNFNLALLISVTLSNISSISDDDCLILLKFELNLDDLIADGNGDIGYNYSLSRVNFSLNICIWNKSLFNDDIKLLSSIFGV